MMHFFDKLQVLGLHGAQTQSAKEKEAFHFAMDAIYFIMNTGQSLDFETYIRSQDAHAPPLVIARFATREEAEANLNSRRPPVDQADVLIADDYYSVIYNPKDGRTHLIRRGLPEYYLADIVNQGLKPSGLSFASKAEAEAWLHQQPTPPQQVVIDIAGAPYLAAYHHRIDYRVLYPLPPPTPTPPASET
ncbi:head protein [Corallococcus sp. bb12-1]|uniref:head protein n=1 Tax=Corallococcus sp. bb12-1 TaxID=2996784 RepID=UPI00226F7BF6|nr:head protein [Corallococcus sp. bb12-1]MCY1040097.1 head protein [Corallococcus sp. bb12-1]